MYYPAPPPTPEKNVAQKQLERFSVSNVWTSHVNMADHMQIKLADVGFLKI